MLFADEGPFSINKRNLISVQEQPSVRGSNVCPRVLKTSRKPTGFSLLGEFFSLQICVVMSLIRIHLCRMKLHSLLLKWGTIALMQAGPDVLPRVSNNMQVIPLVY